MLVAEEVAWRETVVVIGCERVDNARTVLLSLPCGRPRTVDLPVRPVEDPREVLVLLEAAGTPVEAVDVNSEADNGVGWMVVVGVTITGLHPLPRPLVTLLRLTG